VVHGTGGHDQFPLGGGVEAISLQGLPRMLAALQ